MAINGGRDPGAVKNNIQEKDITLDMGLRIGRKLEEYDCEVLYSRTTDVFLDLRPRAIMANNAGADFFLSLHCNSFTTATPNGYEDFIRRVANAKTQRIRNIIHMPISTVWVKHGRTNRGRKTADFAVLRHTTMPAVLVENGFLANVRDAELLRTPAFIQELIDAHVEGIVNALNLEKGNREYIVQPGDTLWSIAASQLGNGTRWGEISALNKLTTQILRAGQLLQIPRI